ncbi:hypothetical protein Tco_1035511 [Tanacetum coccineum]
MASGDVSKCQLGRDTEKRLQDSTKSFCERLDSVVPLAKRPKLWVQNATTKGAFSRRKMQQLRGYVVDDALHGCLVCSLFCEGYLQLSLYASLHVGNVVSTLVLHNHEACCHFELYCMESEEETDLVKIRDQLKHENEVLSRKSSYLKSQVQTTTKAIEMYQQEMVALSRDEAKHQLNISLIRQQRDLLKENEKSCQDTVEGLNAQLEIKVKKTKLEVERRENRINKHYSEYEAKLQKVMDINKKLEASMLARDEMAAQKSWLMQKGLKLVIGGLIKSEEFKETLYQLVQSGQNVGYNMVCNPSTHNQDIMELTKAFTTLCNKDYKYIRDLSTKEIIESNFPPPPSR